MALLDRRRQRDLLALLRALSPKQRKELNRILQALLRRAELRNVKSDKKPQPNLTKRDIGWMLLSSIVCHAMKELWWF